MKAKMMTSGAFPIWPGLDTTMRLRQRGAETKAVMEGMTTRKFVREMLLNRPVPMAAKR